ncbi:MAG: ribonuclease P protein component [Clostridiaceae bacterium]|jgi:ribonuclease P protein component|nr:ribonuclease P protein component [Clostridiaceae bacterium]
MRFRTVANAETLKKNREFSRVYRRGSYHSGRAIALHAYRRRGATAQNPSRIGFTVGRQAIRGAVRRNRAKRLLRESFRLSHVELKTGFDLIVTARWNYEKEPALTVLIEETEQLLLKSGAGSTRSTAR